MSRDFESNYFETSRLIEYFARLLGCTEAFPVSLAKIGAVKGQKYDFSFELAWNNPYV